MNKERFMDKAKHLVIIGFASFICIIVFVWFFNGNKKTTKSTKFLKTNIDKIEDNISMQSVFAHNTSRAYEKAMEELKNVKKELQGMQDLKKELREIKKNRIEDANKKKSLNKMMDEKIYSLKKDISDFKKMATSSSLNNNIKHNKLKKNTKKYDPVKIVSFKKKEKGTFLKDALPAGSIISGKILNGLYVETSVKAASNPQPVVILLTNNGILPQDNVSSVKQCHVIGEATGNLSTERVNIRLVTLSCVMKNKKIVETSISGFITGEDGSQGVRGNVIMRNSKLIKSTLAAGFISGVSKALSNYSSPQTVINTVTGDASKRDFNLQNLGLSAVGGGSSNALDKLVDQYVALTDRISPAIYISGGRKVNIATTIGVEFGSSNVKDTIAKNKKSSVSDSFSQAFNMEDLDE